MWSKPGQTLIDVMEVIKTEIEGVVIIEPRIFKDERGYFYESFSQREFEEKVCRTTFVQDNQSKSSYGVLRGLHFQKPPYAQSKLVRCIKGTVLDVAVDIRRGSPTFGKHVAVELTEQNHLQCFIPRGFAHGFVVLSEQSSQKPYSYNTISFVESVTSIVSMALRNSTLYEMIQEEAHLDAMTGIYNRRYFTRNLEDLFKQWEHDSMSIVLINFDDFHLYNEL